MSGHLGGYLTLLAIAGSAVAFVMKYYQDRRETRRKHFFELMQMLDGSAPLAQKIAAAYQLRFFPEHSEFVVRFSENIASNVQGTAAEVLIEELRLTQEFVGKAASQK